jgi:hypothetical protein
MQIKKKLGHFWELIILVLHLGEMLKHGEKMQKMQMQRCKDAKLAHFWELVILELHLWEMQNHVEKFEKKAKQFS